MKSYLSRKGLRILLADGGMINPQTGSHVQLVHRIKPGKTTIPHPRKELDRRLCGVSQDNLAACSHRREPQEASEL